MNTEPKRDLGWVMFLALVIGATILFGGLAWIFMTMGEMAK